MHYIILPLLFLLLLVDPSKAAEIESASPPIKPVYLMVQNTTNTPPDVPSRQEGDSQAKNPADDKKKKDYTFSISENWRGVFGPGALLYPPYIANPLRPTSSVTMVHVTDNDIPDSGDRRWVIRLGGRVGVLRFHPVGESDRGFQIDLEGAFIGIFDRDNSLDNIGWDGVYGASLAWGNGEGLAAKLAIQHDSSHVGDEYAERTGRQRINYTRQEYAFGLSQKGLKYWRVYGEAGYAFDLRNEELQEEWRVQGGLEFENSELFWKDQAGYYAAVDLMSYEESDWNVDVSVQTGIVIPMTNMPRIWRIGFEYRKGRSIIGEFFQSRETSIGFGLWLDF